MRYATEDDAWGARNGKLYIVANDFETTGTFGGDPRFEGITGQARRALAEALDVLRGEGMPPFAAYLTALGVGLGVVIWTSARAGKTHRRVTPRYARPIAAAVQGGVAGRAAVVGAPGASRVLAMLELKSALEEELATRLALDRVPPRDELVEKARAARVLDETAADDVSRLLASLAHMEAALGMHRRPVLERVRDGDVLSVAARVREILGGGPIQGPIGGPIEGGPIEPAK